jgi:hypothetical protein
LTVIKPKAQRWLNFLLMLPGKASSLDNADPGAAREAAAARPTGGPPNSEGEAVN